MARRFSQMDLALEADISARHLSFLETGRAKPSREMVARLGEAMQLPLDARNQLLTHAGFAARFKSRDWNDADMAPIRQALEWQLERHMPYPGLTVDRLWTIQQANASAVALFAGLGVGVGDSLLDLMMTETLPDVIENWSEVAHHVAIRLRTESAALGGIPEFDAAVRHLSKAALSEAPPPRTVVPTILRQGYLRLAMFATISQFGTPEDLLLDGLKIELYFPMDEVTDIFFKRQAQDKS